MKKLMTICLVVLVAALATKLKAEVLQVPAYGTPTVTSPILKVGQMYLIEVRETFGYDSAGSIADAEWVHDAGWDPNTWVEHYSGDPAALDLLVNGTPQNWKGTTDEVHFYAHTFSPSHTYRLEWLGTGEALTFKIQDGPSQDNSGSLDVEITPFIKVLSPNGGEELIAGQTETVTWEAIDIIDNVSLEYSDANGVNGSWEVIDSNTPNDGEYEWLVPQVTSNQCLVRISDATDPNVYDASDDVFTIYVCQNPLLGDLNEDCYINLADVAIIAMNWLWCGNPFDPSCTLDNGLVAYWSFDEGSGNIAHDNSGNGNDGSLFGDPNWIDGISGKALSFDGNDCVLFGTPVLNIPPYSVCAWVKSDFGLATMSRIPVVMSNGGEAGISYGFTMGFSRPDHEPDAWFFGAKRDQPPKLSTYVYTGRPALSNWALVCITWNASTGIRVYYNGVFQDCDDPPDGYSGDKYARNLVIGAIPEENRIWGGWPVYTFNWDGLVDEVRIYNRVLSDDELQYLYQNP